MKTHLSALAVGVLACGCSLVSALDGYTFDGEERDGGIILDAQPRSDASPSDATVPSDADVSDPDGGRDAGTDACGGCVGDDLVCNPETLACVECLTSAHCPSGVCAGEVCEVAVSVSAGIAHTCATLEDGTVWCWGANGRGELGDGTTENRLRPTRVSGVTNASMVTCGGRWSCALTTTEEIFCWGSNEPDEGMDRSFILGGQEPAFSTTPVRVGAAPGAVGLVAGRDHACYWTASREGYCWGINWGGQLANGTFDWDGSFERVRTGGTPLTVDELGAGGGHTCSREGDSVYCWGYNDFGQVGSGGTITDPDPMLIGVSGRARSLGLGDVHTCATTDDGLYCWGDNPDNRLGDGSVMARSSPVRSLAGGNFLGAAGGFSHTCVWDRSGAAYCFGRGDAGQYGDGTVAVDLEVHRAEIDGVQLIVAGSSHSCAVDDRAAVFCWGGNEQGQLGDNSTTARATPTRVAWP